MRRKSKNGRPKNPNDELGGIRSKLKFGKALAASATYQFKSNPNHEWMLKNFNSLYMVPEFKNTVLRIPFPSSPEEILSTSPLQAPCDYLTEIYWALAICKQYSVEINGFVDLKFSIETSVLLGDISKFGEILSKIKDKFGYSVWYIQNHLLYVQEQRGIEEKKLLAHQYFHKTNSFISKLILFMGIRAEGNSLKNGLKLDTEKFLSNYDQNPAIVNYFRSKITDLPYILLDEIPGILFYEAASSLIDLYESLISILQEISADNSAPASIRIPLANALEVNFKEIDDRRLRNILRGLGGTCSLDDSELPEPRGDLLDKYTQGSYEQFVNGALSYLKDYPNDLVIISLVARSVGKVDNYDFPRENIVEILIDDIHKMWIKNDESFFAAYSSMSLSAKYYSHTWALQLKILIHDLVGMPEYDFPNTAERRLLIHSQFVTPFSLLAFRDTGRDLFLSQMKERRFSPATLNLVEKIVNLEDNFLTEENERLNKYYGRILLSKERWIEAKCIFEKICSSNETAQNSEVALYLVMAYLALAMHKEALQTTIKSYIKNPSIVSKIPFEKIYKTIDEPSKWDASIYEPIFFEIYSSYISKDRDAILKYSFEFFQEANNLSSPVQLVENVDEIGKELVIQYLSKVCIPDIMRQSLIYNGTKEVEDERIRICRALSDLDDQHISLYLDEVRERVKVQEISSGLEIVEQSLVYVDINAITKSLKSRLKDSYSKYKILDNLKKSGTLDFTHLFNVIKDSSPNLNVVFFPLEKDESGSVFEVMFREVTSEFLTSDHGLNAFLSTRIRHGKLRNLLRKSVEEEFLVTAKRADTDIYLKNEHWNEKLKYSNPQVLENVLRYLDIFSKTFDDKISYILDVLLRVEIANPNEVIKNQYAWFIYRSSSLEIAVMRSDDGSDATLDDFIDRCIELLWQKTDANLAEVKRSLTIDLKDEFLSIFDSLSKSIIELTHGDDVQILDAITRARNNTQLKLNTAANWFNRSVVYDRRDYIVDIPVNIAIAIINNIRSGLLSNFANYVKIETKHDNLMLGRTLDGLVDLFGILFENAIDHCGLDINSLELEVTLNYISGKLHIIVVNNISEDVANENSRISLENIKNELGKDGARKFLQSEGRSGFHKIWKIISGPIYGKPSLDFKYTGNCKFIVEIEAILDIK